LAQDSHRGGSPFRALGRARARATCTRAMETVRDRLDRAKASGDAGEVRAALLAAKEAGADPSHIDEALAEVDRVEAEKRRLARERAGLEEEQTAAAGTVAGAEGGAAPTDDEAEQLRVRADAHKRRGNERLKDGTKSAAKEALQCFTDGLEMRCSDPVLNAQLYGNRAHVRILLQQFVEAVDDCRRAIEADPKNMKAYWRAAKASLHLDLCKNGIEFCDAGLRLEPADADLQKMREACATKLAGQQKRRAELAASRGDFNSDDAMAVQDRVNNLNEQMELARSSLVSKQRDHLRAKYTKTSLGELPDDTRVYKSVGRCFIREERDNLARGLDENLGQLEEEIPRMQKACEELEKRRDAGQKELEEMIQTFKRQQQQQAATSPAGAA